MTPDQSPEPLAVVLSLPVGRRCAHCHSYQPTRRVEVTPPDDYTQVFVFVCGNACEAAWSTNQPKPDAPAQARLL